MKAEKSLKPPIALMQALTAVKVSMLAVIKTTPQPLYIIINAQKLLASDPTY